MIKEYILGTIEHETNVINHLVSKMPSNAWDWKPAENMRTTLELLQYLAAVGSATVDAFVNHGDNAAEGMQAFAVYTTEAKKLTPSLISQAMNDECAKVKSLLSTISDEDITSRSTIYPWSGQSLSLFNALMTTVRYYTAYRQQLFMYGKLLGLNINTMNNWAGMDMNVAKPVEEAAA